MVEAVRSRDLVALALLGTQYQQDDPLSEYLCYWHDRNYPTSCGATYPGANAHVFIKNTGVSAVTLDDVVLNTYGLTYALKEANYNGHIANSIWIRWDNPPQAILDAGEPAWFKMDPASIPAGGVGHVVVRLRRVPVTSPLAINVDTSANILNTSLNVNPNAPQLANISSFSSPACGSPPFNQDAYHCTDAVSSLFLR